jgi:DNA-binding transcriptional LysR family regulator
MRAESLNGLYYFAKVVEHGGYSAAARATGIPKSRLSRRVALLERELGARLVNRSTRRFAVTETGREAWRHAQGMLAEAEAALGVVEQAQAEPRGIVRVGCPVALAQSALASLLPEFMTRWPGVRVLLHVSNRRIDVVNEGFDLAIRVRAALGGEDGLIVRQLGRLNELLVASPEYLVRRGRPARPDDLKEFDTLAYAPETERQTWQLEGPTGTVRIELEPRLVSHDFVLLKAAALRGLGIALLSESAARADLDAGRLECVLREWCLPQGVCHMVFPTRRGLRPAVRVLIDFLAERLPPLLGSA